MSQFLLSTYGSDDETPGPATPEEMQGYMERIVALEAEMDANGTFVFGGALDGPAEATVARPAGGDVSMTDGPFAETKEQIAGFYIIDAPDLRNAQTWAGKVADATGRPIEVRAFRASGRVADHLEHQPEL